MTDQFTEPADMADDNVGNVSVDPGERLGALVEYIAGQIVEEDGAFEVLIDDRGNAVGVRLVVAPEVMGRVIGRNGRVARAMRTAVMISGSKHNVRASLDIEERFDDVDVSEDEQTEADEFEQ